MKGWGSTAFLKKSSKKLLNLVAYRVPRRQMYGEAQAVMTFFWFFLFTKRTSYFGFLA